MSTATRQDLEDLERLFDDRGIWLDAAARRRLLELRAEVRAGRVTEQLTRERCRLEFARWLAEHGRIAG